MVENNRLHPSPRTDSMAPYTITFRLFLFRFGNPGKRGQIAQSEFRLELDAIFHVNACRHRFEVLCIRWIAAVCGDFARIFKLIGQHEQAGTRQAYPMRQPTPAAVHSRSNGVFPCYFRYNNEQRGIIAVFESIP